MLKILGNILKHRAMARRKAVRFLAVFLGLAVIPGAAVIAQVPPPRLIDPFQVREVPVDVTAATITEARERGLTEGRIGAFRSLVERMVQRESIAAVTMPPASQIIDMVLEFSVANERASAVRYLADLTVRFNPDAVRAFLRSQNVPFAETASKPMLIVPVLQEGGAAQLWQDSNVWREAWAKIMPHDGLVPFVVPLGDLDDIGLLSVDQALAKDRAALDRIVSKYGAVGAVVAKATAANQSISMTLSEMRPLGAAWDGRANVALIPGQSRDDFFQAAALEAARVIEEGWKQRNILRFGEGGKLTALITVKSLQDWLSVKARLAQVPVVERVELQAISKNLVQAVIAFAGDQSQLQFALSQRDLDLSQDGDVWLLRSGSNREEVEPAPLETPAAVAQPKS